MKSRGTKPLGVRGGLWRQRQITSNSDGLPRLGTGADRWPHRAAPFRFPLPPLPSPSAWAKNQEPSSPDRFRPVPEVGSRQDLKRRCQKNSWLATDVIWYSHRIYGIESDRLMGNRWNRLDSSALSRHQRKARCLEWNSNISFRVEQHPMQSINYPCRSLLIPHHKGKIRKRMPKWEEEEEKRGSIQYDVTS